MEYVLRDSFAFSAFCVSVAPMGGEATCIHLGRVAQLLPCWSLVSFQAVVMVCLPLFKDNGKFIWVPESSQVSDQHSLIWQRLHRPSLRGHNKVKQYVKWIEGCFCVCRRREILGGSPSCEIQVESPWRPYGHCVLLSSSFWALSTLRQLTFQSNDILGWKERLT